MNIENKNFTNFQNVNLRGTPGVVSGNFNGGVLRFSAGNATYGYVSSGTWDSTVAIVPMGGATVGAVTTTDEVPYFSIANAGLSLGTGYIRIVPGGNATGNNGTLSVGTGLLDSDRAWQLPNVSGIFPVSGTFSIDIPAIGAANYLSTVVTVAGMRNDCGVIVSPQSVTAANLLSARAPVQVSNAVPGSGNITLVLQNYWATASIATGGSVWAYTIVR